MEFGKLVKMAKAAAGGAVGVDALSEMLSQLGIEATFECVPPENAKGEFEGLWLEGTGPRASLMRIELAMANGDRFAGLAVVTNKGDGAHNKPEFST